MKKKTPCTWVWKKVAKGGDWFVWWSLVCFAPRPLLCKPLDLFAQERIPSLLVGKLVEQQRGKSSVSQISGWGWFWPRPARETTHSMHRFLASLSSLPQQSNNNCSTEESSDHHFQNLKFISWCAGHRTLNKSKVHSWQCSKPRAIFEKVKSTDSLVRGTPAQFGSSLESVK